ncbi:MAG: hypothetical protein WC179_10105, partial [Candidatus Cloacimonadaceae bacterium]
IRSLPRRWEKSMVEINPKKVMVIVDRRERVLWRCIAGIRMILGRKGMDIFLICLILIYMLTQMK